MAKGRERGRHEREQCLSKQSRLLPRSLKALIRREAGELSVGGSRVINASQASKLHAHASYDWIYQHVLTALDVDPDLVNQITTRPPTRSASLKRPSSTLIAPANIHGKYQHELVIVCPYIDGWATFSCMKS